MWNAIQSHQLVAGVALMWVVSTAIGALPSPKDGSSAFYEWFFKFAQTLGGAIPRLLAIYSPQLLTTLTGQTSKTTDPPNPPLNASELKEEKL